MILSSGQALPAEQAPDLGSVSGCALGAGMGCQEPAFLRVGSARGVRREDRLPSGSHCSLLQHPHPQGPHQPRDTGPWPPKPVLPGTLPQARYERESRADGPAKHGSQPSKAKLVPRPPCAERLRERKDHPASGACGWAGRLSSLPLAVEELGGAGRRPRGQPGAHWL